MTKKNLPNIPLYIGDWEKDCNVLSLESEAAWLRIIFKMFTSGKQSTYKLPTKGLQNLWRVSEEKANEIIEELIDYNICEIQLDGRFIEFKCRRFEKENEISVIRKDAVSNRKDRVKKPKKVLQTLYKNNTKDVQNTEIEIESESEYEIENKNEIAVVTEKEGLGEKTKVDVQKIVQIFNSVCKNLPNVQKVTKQRESMVKARVKEYGLSKIGDVFQLVSQSSFLNGENDRGWKADFDWIMNPNNFIKTLEGKYNGKRNNSISKSDSDHKESAVSAVGKMFGIEQ